jgi:hypothetical protein
MNNIALQFLGETVHVTLTADGYAYVAGRSDPTHPKITFSYNAEDDSWTRLGWENLYPGPWLFDSTFALVDHYVGGLDNPDQYAVIHHFLQQLQTLRQ